MVVEGWADAAHVRHTTTGSQRSLEVHGSMCAVVCLVRRMYVLIGFTLAAERWLW